MLINLIAASGFLNCDAEIADLKPLSEFFTFGDAFRMFNNSFTAQLDTNQTA